MRANNGIGCVCVRVRRGHDTSGVVFGAVGRYIYTYIHSSVRSRLPATPALTVGFRFVVGNRVGRGGGDDGPKPPPPCRAAAGQNSPIGPVVPSPKLNQPNASPATMPIASPPPDRLAVLLGRHADGVVPARHGASRVGYPGIVAQRVDRAIGRQVQRDGEGAGGARANGGGAADGGLRAPRGTTGDGGCAGDRQRPSSQEEDGGGEPHIVGGGGVVSASSVGGAGVHATLLYIYIYIYVGWYGLWTLYITVCRPLLR